MWKMEVFWLINLTYILECLAIYQWWIERIFDFSFLLVVKRRSVVIFSYICYVLTIWLSNDAELFHRGTYISQYFGIMVKICSRYEVVFRFSTSKNSKISCRSTPPPLPPSCNRDIKYNYVVCSAVDFNRLIDFFPQKKLMKNLKLENWFESILKSRLKLFKTFLKNPLKIGLEKLTENRFWKIDRKSKLKN